MQVASLLYTLYRIARGWADIRRAWWAYSSLVIAIKGQVVIGCSSMSYPSHRYVLFVHFHRHGIVRGAEMSKRYSSADREPKAEESIILGASSLQLKLL